MKTVHYFTIRARPTPACPDFIEVGGAYVSCWIRHEDIAIAEQIAMESISENGWTVEETEERKVVSRADYTNHQSLEYFDQAMIDGEVFVFHNWPTGCEDDEIDLSDKK